MRNATLISCMSTLFLVQAFNTYSVLPDAQKSLRSVVHIPAGVGDFNAGGFAAGSLDGRIRLYHADGQPAGTLIGHTAGVVDLALSHDNSKLISGSWDGSAIVWDLSTKNAIAELGKQENAVCVAALDNGNIATGSTGQKSEAGQHVDFRVRIWAPSGPAGYTCVLTLEDHAQAVRSLAALPGGGFASGSNDGTVKVRDANGQVLTTWSMPAPDYASGVPAFVFGVAHLPAGVASPGAALADADGDSKLQEEGHPGYVAACCEDGAVRVYELVLTASGAVSGGSLVSTIRLSGVPWVVTTLPSNDIVIGCNQAGTSGRGHVYVFTTDASRTAADSVLAKFETDCRPPPKGKVGQAGAGEESIKPTAHYNQRQSHPGATEGQYGFFNKEDGSVWACMWSASSGTWLDVGQVTDAPEQSGGSSTNHTAADGKEYDNVRDVSVDAGGGGMTSMRLAWNAGEDPVDVTKRFLAQNGLPQEHYSQVRDFVLQQMGPGAAASGAPAAPRFTSIPVTKYAFFDNIKFEAAFGKIKQNSEVLVGSHPDVAMQGTADEAAFEALQEVAQKRSFYHSSPFPAAAKALLGGKLLKWPPAQLAPVIDLLRMLCMHEAAAGAMSRSDFGSDVPALLAATMSGGASSPALKLLACRCAVNMFHRQSLRLAATKGAAAVVEAAASLLSAPDSDGLQGKAKCAASTLLLNVSTAVADAVEGGDLAASGVDTDALSEVLCLYLAMALQDTAVASDLAATTNCVLALGTLAVKVPAAKQAAAANDLPAVITAAASVLQGVDVEGALAVAAAETKVALS